MGLGENVEKGFHPYRYTNVDYMGNIVDKKYFDVEGMNRDKKKF